MSGALLCTMAMLLLGLPGVAGAAAPAAPPPENPYVALFIVGTTAGTLPGSPDRNTGRAGEVFRAHNGFVAMYRT